MIKLAFWALGTVVMLGLFVWIGRASVRTRARRRLMRQLEADGFTVLEVTSNLGGPRLEFLAVDHENNRDVRGTSSLSDPTRYRFNRQLTSEADA